MSKSYFIVILSNTEFLYVKWHHKVIYLYKQERTMNMTRIQWFSLGLLLGIHIPTALVGLIIYPFFSVSGEVEERILPGTGKRKLEAALVSAQDKALNEIHRAAAEDKSDVDK